MNFKYENAEAEEYFSDFKLMKKKMGNNIARIIKKRYDNLKAAANFSIYLSTGLGKPHPLTGNLKGYYGISISGNTRLVVRPETDSLDSASLKECDTIMIKGVVDYHGKKHEWLIP